MDAIGNTTNTCNILFKKENSLEKSMILRMVKYDQPLDIIKQYQNSIFILSSLGLREELNKDDIDFQIINMTRFKYKFNINETLVFRLKQKTNIILIYFLYTNTLIGIETTQIVFNGLFYIDNYLFLFFDKKKIEIINFKIKDKITSLPISRKTNNIKDFLQLSCYLYNQDDLFIIEHKLKKENFIDLGHYSLDEYPISEQENILFGTNIISSFIIHKKESFCIERIHNNKIFYVYYVEINDHILFFKNVLELIRFINEHFFQPLKECSLLIDPIKNL